MGTSATPDPALLDAASRGDEQAFRRLVEPHRTELHAHCYRMLGSLDDADDALQETLLRAWRALPRFSGQRLLRPWLYRIATNVCLNALARRPRRLSLPTAHSAPARPDDDPGEPSTEAVWVQPYPDEAIGLGDSYASPEARYEQREAVELAFIVALQHLPATQRAVLILRDVLGFSAVETAAALGTTAAAVNSVIAAFAAAPAHRYLPARANGQPANAAYRWNEQRGCYVAEALEVLTLEDRQITEMVAFMTPEIFPRFGLPETLPV